MKTALSTINEYNFRVAEVFSYSLTLVLHFLHYHPLFSCKYYLLPLVSRLGLPFCSAHPVPLH